MLGIFGVALGPTAGRRRRKVRLAAGIGMRWERSGLGQAGPSSDLKPRGSLFFIFYFLFFGLALFLLGRQHPLGGDFPYCSFPLSWAGHQVCVRKEQKNISLASCQVLAVLGAIALLVLQCFASSGPWRERVSKQHHCHRQLYLCPGKQVHAIRQGIRTHVLELSWWSVGTIKTTSCCGCTCPVSWLSTSCQPKCPLGYKFL